MLATMKAKGVPGAEVQVGGGRARLGGWVLQHRQTRVTSPSWPCWQRPARGARSPGAPAQRVAAPTALPQVPGMPIAPDFFSQRMPMVRSARAPGWRACGWAGMPVGSRADATEAGGFQGGAAALPQALPPPLPPNPPPAAALAARPCAPRHGSPALSKRLHAVFQKRGVIDSQGYLSSEAHVLMSDRHPSACCLLARIVGICPDQV